ncbi:MAG: hypothetical protein KC423_29115, partial [Anaerolineales bacterium]|nr:hypothetical protein [Anaerolineales bacterium]
RSSTVFFFFLRLVLLPFDVPPRVLERASACRRLLDERPFAFLVVVVFFCAIAQMFLFCVIIAQNMAERRDG